MRKWYLYTQVGSYSIPGWINFLVTMTKYLTQHLRKGRLYFGYCLRYIPSEQRSHDEVQLFFFFFFIQFRSPAHKTLRLTFSEGLLISINTI